AESLAAKGEEQLLAVAREREAAAAQQVAELRDALTATANEAAYREDAAR
ncbi:hypothetical protein HaLaN_20692, partial [Haematococcus lacustris]